MQKCMLYNFPHSMGSENLILTTFQKRLIFQKTKIVLWDPRTSNGLNVARFSTIKLNISLLIWKIACFTTSPIVWALNMCLNHFACNKLLLFMKQIDFFRLFDVFRLFLLKTNFVPQMFPIISGCYLSLIHI